MNPSATFAALALLVFPVAGIGQDLAHDPTWSPALEAGQSDAYSPPPAPGVVSTLEHLQAEREVTRVGRVSLLAGEASWFAESLASQGWVRAEPNLPILSRSSLSTARGARAEVRIGGVSVSLDSDSQADFVRVDDDGFVIRVSRGSVALSVASFAQDELIEMSTANARLQARSSGTYVLGSDPGTGETVAKAIDGQADLRVGVATLPLIAGQQAHINSAGPLSHERRNIVVSAFDRWVAEREDHWSSVAASQYVSPDMSGADVLPSYGDWQHDQSLGAIWYPTLVDAGWAPYRDGRWRSLQPWGRVWVEAAPWGFATSYHGRWHRVHDRWGWVPGAQERRPLFTPPPPGAPRPVPAPVAAPWPAPGQRPDWQRPIGSLPQPPRQYPTPPRTYPNPQRVNPNPAGDFPTPARSWPNPGHPAANLPKASSRILAPPPSLAPAVPRVK